VKGFEIMHNPTLVVNDAHAVSLENPPVEIPDEWDLSPRESEALLHLLKGKKQGEIAKEMGIRPGTVKAHLKHIFDKSGIRGRFGVMLHFGICVAEMGPVSLTHALNKIENIILREHGKDDQSRDSQILGIVYNCRRPKTSPKPVNSDDTPQLT
jgi:DNA-binding CsgD family transcriptional regulator